MAISTVNVDFSAILQNAAQATGLLRVRLSQVGTVEDSETGDTVILPIAWQETTLTDGAATLALVPNKIIEPSCTYYEIQMKSVPDCPKACAKLLLSGIMYVPDEDCNVLDLLISPPSPETANTASGYASQAKQAAQVAENFAIQAGDRYDDVAEAAATALTDIGTAKQDALDAIGTAQSGATEAISTAEEAALQAIGQARGTALDDIGTAQGTAIGSVQAEGNTQVGRVEDAGEDAVADVTAAQATAVSVVQAQQATSVEAVSAEGTAQVNAVTQAGNGYVATMQGLVSDAQAARDAAQTAQGLAEAAQDAAESASTDAQGYAGDASTSAGQAAQSASDAATSATAAQASAESIEASAEQIQTNEQNISNIQALLNGTLYREDTDSTAAYSKAVPAGALPYATINDIGGRTVVWNQLVDSDTISVTLLAGHKYYAEISGTASIMTGAGTAQAVTGGTDIVIDLTLMFGSGNEPTSVAEFEAMFPSIDPAYNAGELRSAGVTEVVSEGRNILDVSNGAYTDSAGCYMGATDGLVKLAGPSAITTSHADTVNVKLWRREGNYGAYTSITESNSWIIYPGTYTLTINNVQGTFDTSNIYVWVSVGEIGNTYANAAIHFYKNTKSADLTSTFSITSTQRILITIQKENSTAQTNVTFNFQLECGSTATAYTPYRFPVSYPIPSAIQSLPGYGWSTHYAYNGVDFVSKKYSQRVVKKILNGSSSDGVWSVAFDYVEGTRLHRMFCIGLPNLKISPSTEINFVIRNLLSDSYEVLFIADMVEYNGWTIRQAYGASSIYFSCPSNLQNTVTLDAFKAMLAANPVTLYYELAEAIETDISEYLTDDNLIEVEPGGTITFENQRGDDWRVPVPNEETFLVQATPELPTTDGTYTLQCTVTDGTPSVTWVTA